MLADLVDGGEGAGDRRRRRPPGSRATCAWPTSLAKAVRDRRAAAARATSSCRYGLRRSARAPRRAPHRRAAPAAASAPTTPAAGSSRRGCSTRSAPAAATPIDAGEVRERTRPTDEVREALERMWPVLTPAAAARTTCSARAALLRLRRRRAPRRGRGRARSYRPRSERRRRRRLDRRDDVAAARRGAELCSARGRTRNGPEPDDEIRTYGHIVVDEAQDLSPMQLRMLTRRSLNGSMTVVGDIAQATGRAGARRLGRGARAPARPPPGSRAELTVGYRIPAPNMALAGPRAAGRRRPAFAAPIGSQDGDGRAARPPALRRRLGQRGRRGACESSSPTVGDGQRRGHRPASLADAVADALDGCRRRRTAGPRARASTTGHGRAGRPGEGPRARRRGRRRAGRASSTEEPQGLRALYVALTRATKRLDDRARRAAARRARGVTLQSAAQSAVGSRDRSSNE